MDSKDYVSAPLAKWGFKFKIKLSSLFLSLSFSLSLTHTHTHTQSTSKRKFIELLLCTRLDKPHRHRLWSLELQSLSGGVTLDQLATSLGAKWTTGDVSITLYDHRGGICILLRTIPQASQTQKIPVWGCSQQSPNSHKSTRESQSL